MQKLITTKGLTKAKGNKKNILGKVLSNKGRMYFNAWKDLNANGNNRKLFGEVLSSKG